MTAIKIHMHLDSETIHVPELRPLVGKDVEIVVFEKSPPVPQGIERFLKSGGRNLVDPEAVERLREISKI